MNHLIKVLAANPDDLSSIPRIYKVEKTKTKNFLKLVIWHTSMCKCTYIHIKNAIKNVKGR